MVRTQHPLEVHDQRLADHDGLRRLSPKQTRWYNVLDSNSNSNSNADQVIG